jgi:hypothetical protein
MSKKTKNVEWLGGIYATLPEVKVVASGEVDAKHYMASGGEIRIKGAALQSDAPPAESESASETLAWMTADGTVVGKASFAANHAALHAVDSFWRTTKEPAIGIAHTPTRLVIGDPALAGLLRKALGPSIEVANQDAMELDELMEAEFDLYPINIDASHPALAALLPQDEEN